MRSTRKDLVEKREMLASLYPVHLVAVNFNDDLNLGLLVRAAACFGASSVIVIGRMPEYRILRQISVGLSRHIEIKQVSSPSEFLRLAKEHCWSVVSVELCEGATPIMEHRFKKTPTALVLGHETTGVPVEIIHNSTPVYIPMPGIGKCLNTSQAANVALYEYMRQTGAMNSSELESF